MVTTQVISTVDGRPVKGVSFEAGDVQVSISGAPFENVTNLPSTRRNDSSIIDLSFLTAEESVVGAEIRFEDQTTPAEWLGSSITIEEDEVLDGVNEAISRTEVVLTTVDQIEIRTGTGGPIQSNQVAINTAIGALPTAAQIAAQADLAAIDRGDGTDLIGAIVSEVGNQNVNEAVLVEQIRLALERTGGLLETSANGVGLSATDIDAIASAILASPANPIATNSAGAVTTSNPTTGGVGSAHTPADVAAEILANPANKLATNADGQVTPDDSVKKLGDSILHTNVGSVEGVSDTTIETRV